ncbi:hypothetical protein [Salipiger marinus]|uniref:hypothetical protein n=1 Tax=Salipiger marinus TaxID=555512 RepID=UPI004059634A
MIAVGLCRAEEAGEFDHVQAGPLALLWQPDGPDTDRLDHCLAAQEQLGAFLPFSPRQAPKLAAACDWIRPRIAALSAALDDLAGQGEMLVTLQPDSTGSGPPSRSGRDWLRERTLQHARLRAMQDRLRDLLPGAHLLPTSPGAPVEATVLLPPDLMHSHARTLHAACPEGVDCRVSGPWPAFGYAAALTARLTEPT